MTSYTKAEFIALGTSFLGIAKIINLGDALIGFTHSDLDQIQYHLRHQDEKIFLAICEDELPDQDVIPIVGIVLPWPPPIY